MALICSLVCLSDKFWEGSLVLTKFCTQGQHRKFDMCIIGQGVLYKLKQFWKNVAVLNNFIDCSKKNLKKNKCAYIQTMVCEWFVMSCIVFCICSVVKFSKEWREQMKIRWCPHAESALFFLRCFKIMVIGLKLTLTMMHAVVFKF